MNNPSRWPLATAVVATHNRPHFLTRAVQSILGQDYPGEIECLVVFDRQEPVRPPVEVPAGRELRLLSNDRTPGLAGARNTGILAARGDFVAFCDDDDEWLPRKLRAQIEALRQRQDAVVGTCGIRIRYGRRTFVRPLRRRIIGLDDLTRSRRMEVHSSTLVVRRDRLLGEIGLVDEATPGSYGEDYDFLLRAAQVGPLVGVPEPLVRIQWQSSYFADRWQMIIDGLGYQLRKHPELAETPRGLSRMYGRMAFGYAALGRMTEARTWARRALALNWRQPRGYLTYLVSLRVIPARTVVRLANWFGRGV